MGHNAASDVGIWMTELVDLLLLGRGEFLILVPRVLLHITYPLYVTFLCVISK